MTAPIPPPSRLRQHHSAISQHGDQGFGRCPPVCLSRQHESRWIYSTHWPRPGYPPASASRRRSRRCPGLPLDDLAAVPFGPREFVQLGHSSAARTREFPRLSAWRLNHLGRQVWRKGRRREGLPGVAPPARPPASARKPRDTCRTRRGAPGRRVVGGSGGGVAEKIRTATPKAAGGEALARMLTIAAAHSGIRRRDSWLDRFSPRRR